MFHEGKKPMIILIIYIHVYIYFLEWLSIIISVRLSYL